MSNGALEYASDVPYLLSTFISAVDKAVAPDTLQERINKALEPFGPDGPWRYAPEQERQRAEKGEREAHAQASGEALYVLEQHAKQASAFLEPIEAELMEPIDPVGAWQRARGKTGELPPSDVINLSVLSELHYARFDRNLGEAKASVVLAAYTAATVAPLKQEHANLIRWVETRHRGTWNGRDLEGSIDEAMAVQKLQTAITAARQARIPDDVRHAREAIRVAEDIASRARANGVRAVIPAGWVSR